MSVNVPKGKDIGSSNLSVTIVLKKIKSLEETIELREDIADIFRSERSIKNIVQGRPYVKYNSDKEVSNLSVYIEFIYKKDDIYTYKTWQSTDYKEWTLYIKREDLGNADELENVTKYDYSK